MKKLYNTDKEKKEAIKLKNKRAYQKNKLWHKKHREKNREKVRAYMKEYYKNTDEGIAAQKRKEYKINNPEEINKNVKKNKSLYQKNRKDGEPMYKLKANTRTMISNLLKNRGFTKNDNTNNIVGCSFEKFRYHIESQWKPWMNWDNYGNPKDGILEENKTWDLDHIIPMSSAKTENDVINLNHYSNLQPLCSYTNRYIKKDIYKF